MTRKTKGCFSFNKEMAKLLPSKIMTRKIIKEKIKRYSKNNEKSLIKNYSKYQVGDILWIREPAKIITLKQNKIWYHFIDEEKRYINIPERLKNNKKEWLYSGSWIPFGCLKEMARYFIKIINIRVERLQDGKFGLLGQESFKEGCPFNFRTITKYETDRWFRTFWDKTAPKGYKWKDNPFVVVYEWEYVK